MQRHFPSTLRHLWALCPVLPALLATLPAQTPIVLTGWTAASYPAVSGFPAGVWNVAASGLAVTQSQNGQPTLFFSDFLLWNQRIEGQFVVGAGDDDYVGFALGWQPGDESNAAADYLLLDWKSGTQTFNFGAPSCTPGSTAHAGIALSRVSGIPTADEMWGHVDLNTSPCSTAGDRLTELQRGATLGTAGWAHNQVYTVRIDYTPNRVQAWVDGVLQIDVPGTFPNGRIAFYNFSQGNVTYSAFTQDCIGSWSNYGTGWPGAAGVPGLTASAAPVLGSVTDIQMGSAATALQPGLLALGFDRVVVPTPLGGDLLVNYVVTEAYLLPASPGLATRPFAIPSAAVFCGLEVAAQLVHFDTASATGFAFSRGLALAIGH